VRRALLAGLVLMILAAAFGHSAQAAERKLPNAPALLSADRVSYDEELGIVVASGHVEISQQDRILRADTVTYNQRTDTVTASGNVSLVEPTGEVLFGNFFELTGGLKDGVAQDFRLLLTDKSRFAAAGARRSGGTISEMAKGVYSPCELCKDDPERAPLWQVKAARIVHDQSEHEVYYQDATLEMFGVPVAYTPYFSHPDPTVKRKSGFLAPLYGSDTRLGAFTRIPYFWVLDDDKDATIAPIFTTREGPVFDGEYRERWGSGKIDLEGSITNPGAFNEAGNSKPGNQLRGHFHGDGIFNIDEDWRTGFDASRETDDTYLRRYKVLYRPPTVLTTNSYVEGFFGRSYNALNAWAFQDTRATVLIKNQPIVAPIYDFNYVSEAGSYGQRWRVNANALNLFRPSGVDSRRLSQRTEWELPYASAIGDLYTLTLSLETDGYATKHNVALGNPTGEPESTGRALPQGKFEWRYPWARQDGAVQEIIEPRAAFIAGPQARNSTRIPNEDSLDFEFDDENLFRLNPFPGVDRVEGGERIVYGLSAGAYGAKGGATSAFFGQQYRFNKDDTFDPVTSGLQDNLSDYVGRLQIRPLNYVDLTYRFRLSKRDLAPRRTEVVGRAGPSFFWVGVNYVNLIQQVPGQGLTTIDQVGGNVNTRLTDHWSTTSGGVRDLELGKTRSLYFGVTYNDECFTMTARAVRSFATDRDIKPSNTFLVQLIYKHLGDVSLSGSGT
jgi:LPS-assembly protein